MIYGFFLLVFLFFKYLFNFFFLENVVCNSSSLELPGLIWTKIEFNDNLPALKGHSAIKIMENCIYVFGGINQNDIITDSSYIIDIDIKEIYSLETKGKKPCARAFHVIIYLF